MAPPGALFCCRQLRITDKLGELGVPYMFATGDVKLAATSAYRHRPRLEKPVLETELVRRLADLIAAT